MDTQTETLLSQILENIKKISKVLDEHTLILNKHSDILNEHTNILNEHSNILNEHTNILNEHSNRLSTLENITFEHSQKIQNIENIVTKIEIEHGEKIQTLFDCYSINNEKFEELRKDISDIKTILDKHDNKIFYLDYYKNQKILPETN